ncbi:hypothetical protein GF327_10110 [Candidatus Woesearchaeota archaeon]|nr:hypothetical protein [Candidatus Woesearchaeota archaeon]
MKQKIPLILKEVSRCISKSQEKDGSWRLNKKITTTGPGNYHHEIVLTSLAANTLLLAAPEKYGKNIEKAIAFCEKYEFDNNTDLVILSYLLKTIRISNTEYSEKLKKKITKIIYEKQAKGFWPDFPETSILKNYTIISSLENPEKNAKKTLEWLKSSRAKDKKGWGLKPNSESSEISFTANAILSAIYLGEDPSAKYIQNAASFLKKLQLKNSGWPSSKYTDPDKATIYSTSVVILALMLTQSEEVSDSIQKGINYIEDARIEGSGWGLFKKDKIEQNYTTYYSVLVLSYYHYFVERLADEDFRKIYDCLAKKQAVNIYLYKQFLRVQKYSFLEGIFKEPFSSSLLGTTSDSIKRRKDILKILSSVVFSDASEMVDLLKEHKKYEDLSKRYHMTLVKNDLLYLNSLNICGKEKDKYYLARKIF